jgi:putative ABC transport system ATP-binding protein
MSVIAGLEHASKRFTVGEEVIVAVDAVTFGVTEGEFACISGASGSGKTTMLNILAGIDTADSGDVVVAGHSLSGRSESARADIRLRSIGVVFQSNNLLAEFTARENVALPLMVRGMGRTAANVTAQAALDSIGLADLGGRLPGRMSGGQRQRVGIARAFAGEQKLLIADEPTGALDSENSRALFALMRELCDRRGTAVVLATHDPLAQDFADSTYLMVDGVVTVR